MTNCRRGGRALPSEMRAPRPRARLSLGSSALRASRLCARSLPTICVGTLVLEFAHPLFDRLASVSAVAPEGHGRDSARTGLLVHPGGGNAEQLGDVVCG